MSGIVTTAESVTFAGHLIRCEEWQTKSTISITERPPLRHAVLLSVKVLKKNLRAVFNKLCLSADPCWRIEIITGDYSGALVPLTRWSLYVYCLYAQSPLVVCKRLYDEGLLTLHGVTKHVLYARDYLLTSFVRRNFRLPVLGLSKTRSIDLGGCSEIRAIRQSI